LCLHGVLTLPSSPHDRLVPYTTLFRSTSAPNFGRLQHRLGRSGADAVAASSQVPAQLVVFDLLELDGNKLTSQPYTHRREKLFETVDGAASDAVLVPEAFEGGLRDALDASKTRGLEGVMAKR